MADKIPTDGHGTRVTSAAGQPPIRTVILTFLKIGAIGCGGGMAIIAVMEQALQASWRWWNAFRHDSSRIECDFNGSCLHLL